MEITTNGALKELDEFEYEEYGLEDFGLGEFKLCEDELDDDKFDDCELEEYEPLTSPKPYTPKQRAAIDEMNAELQRVCDELFAMS